MRFRRQEIDEDAAADPSDFTDRVREAALAQVPPGTVTGRGVWAEQVVAPSGDRAAIAAAIAAASSVAPEMTLLELAALANFLDLLPQATADLEAARADGRAGRVELRVWLEYDPEEDR